MAHLSQKERLLLQDQLSHEQICITKYTGYSSRAKDAQVRKMFNEFASEEQQHYDTINNLLQSEGRTSDTMATQSGGTQGSGKSERNRQAGSQGAGWQTTGRDSQAGAVSYSLTNDMGQSGGQGGRTGDQMSTRMGSQTGSYQATSGASQQGWMSETRTIYGGQMTDTANEGTTRGARSTDFEAGSDMSISAGDDKSMLEDMLMTEKYISGAYDTSIFETANTQVRQSLQHIQRDEQKHGEEIFKYMQQHGMYQAE